MTVVGTRVENSSSVSVSISQALRPHNDSIAWLPAMAYAMREGLATEPTATAHLRNVARMRLHIWKVVKAHNGQKAAVHVVLHWPLHYHSIQIIGSHIQQRAAEAHLGMPARYGSGMQNTLTPQHTTLHTIRSAS